MKKLLIKIYKMIWFNYEVWKLERDVNAPYDDICCCGDSMTNHESSYYCSHQPVSMKGYAINSIRLRIYGEKKC